MTKMKFLLILLASLLPALISQAQRKAVFIILDGIPADVIEKIETPFLNEIASEGGYTRSYVGGEKGEYNESPTISAPGYNHLLTGTWTHKHNVWDNDIESPNYHYWNIFRIAETSRPDIRTAIFSSWTDNRTKLVGERLPGAGGIKLDYSYDGLELDTVRFPHTRDRAFMFDIDEAISSKAGEYILENGPDLSWVYLEFTDDMGHMYGDSPQLFDAVRKADTQVGRIWKAIREREATLNEHWMIVVTTDHGRDAGTGTGHGNQTDRERTTWLTTNLSPLNDHFRQTPAVVDIMPSILRFMEIPIPPSTLEELDGIPFTGKVSISRLAATRDGKRIRLTWNVLDPEGQLEVLITSTNLFREGKRDSYASIGKVDVSEGYVEIDADHYSGFCKILVKAPYNWCNVWLIDR
ncbi:MAG TPA: alkaline phosphatase family protein [Cyclobacteriaceae bacterium]